MTGHDLLWALKTLTAEMLALPIRCDGMTPQHWPDHAYVLIRDRQGMVGAHILLTDEPLLGVRPNAVPLITRADLTQPPGNPG